MLCNFIRVHLDVFVMWDIETDVCADYDSDGNFNMKDLVMIIRTLVNKK